MAEPLLAIEDVRAGYGSAIVLDGVSFDLASQGALAHDYGLYAGEPRPHPLAWRRHHP